MSVALRSAARSDVGMVRSTNQDSAYAGPDLLVVADGMGGHAGGDVASALAVGELAGLDDGAAGSTDALQALREHFGAAHDALLRRVGEEPGLAGMGTTVTALLRAGDRLALAHIGDSRGYLLREGRLRQVTHDHTFVQGLVDEGRISAEEAEHHPQRSVIMRVLGAGDSDVEPDTSWCDVVPGDRWLLCSDGLSGVVGHDVLAETLRERSDVAECADALVELAMASGAPDNVTVVVADVVQAAAPGDTAVDGGAQHAAATPTAQVVGSVATRTGGAHDLAPAAAGTSTPADTDSPAGTDADDEARQGPADGAAPGDSDRDRPRRGWGLLGLLLVVAVVAAGAAGAWAWGRQQFFVATDGDTVAIYRGLQQDLGPIGLSEVYEEEDLRLDDLPSFWRNRVRTGIGADGLADARQVVSQLSARSQTCRQAAEAAAAASEAGAPPVTVPPRCEGIG